MGGWREVGGRLVGGLVRTGRLGLGDPHTGGGFSPAVGSGGRLPGCGGELKIDRRGLDTGGCSWGVRRGLDLLGLIRVGSSSC